MGSFHLGPGAVAYTVRHPERVSRLILYSTFACGHNLTNEDVKTSIISMVRSHWGIARRTLADLTSPGVSGEILERIASDEGHSASGETVTTSMKQAAATAKMRSRPRGMPCSFLWTVTYRPLGSESKPSVVH